MPTLVLYGDSDAALGPQLWKGLDRVVTGVQVCLRLGYSMVSDHGQQSTAGASDGALAGWESLP